MPVEQGLPWDPVATGLAGQAIPFIVAASHAHAPPCSTPRPLRLGHNPPRPLDVGLFVRRCLTTAPTATASWRCCHGP